MPEYKESNVNGVSWNRFKEIRICNPRNEVPHVICSEEQVVSADGAEQRTEIGSMGFRFDPSIEFPVLDPSTNQPTGQIATGAQVYALIYSYVLAEAAKRDAPQIGEDVVMVPEEPPE